MDSLTILFSILPLGHRTIILSTIQVSSDPSCPPSILPSFHSCIHLFLHWSSTHLSILPYICPSIHPFFHSSISIHLYPSFYPSIHPPFHPSIHLVNTYLVSTLDHADIPQGEVSRSLGFLGMLWCCPSGHTVAPGLWPSGSTPSLELRVGGVAPAVWPRRRPPTCAHDQAGGAVPGVHGARHVGVVCPAQVQVQVAVRLQGGEGVAVSAGEGAATREKAGPRRTQPRGFRAGRQRQGVLEEWEEGGRRLGG